MHKPSLLVYCLRLRKTQGSVRTRSGMSGEVPDYEEQEWMVGLREDGSICLLSFGLGTSIRCVCGCQSEPRADVGSICYWEPGTNVGQPANREPGAGVTWAADREPVAEVRWAAHWKPVASVGYNLCDLLYWNQFNQLVNIHLIFTPMHKYDMVPGKHINPFLNAWCKLPFWTIDTLNITQ